MEDLDPAHQEKKRTLQGLGVAMLLIGGIFAAIGFINFFSSFGSSEPPRLFWTLFIGMPLAGWGVKIVGVGFLGEIGRYGAGEVAPVAKEALDYLAEGDRGQRSADELVVCGDCHTTNRPDAAFCAHCGTPLSQNCDECGLRQTTASRFCDGCGAALA